MKNAIWLACAAGVIGCALIGCKSAPPANVAATVNGRAITYTELDKAFKMAYPQNADGTSEDLIQTQRMEAMRSLIDNEILLQRAEKLSVMATDADVDTKINEFRAPFTKEQFEQQLKAKSMTLDDLKMQVRKDLSVEKLINKEITSHINITDADVSGFYAANRKSFNLAEPTLHLMQIVVTPNPDPNVRNLKGDKAKNDDEASKKIRAIEARLKQGQDFAMMAQNFSEDPASAPNGGDLGNVPESALEKSPADLRKLVLSMTPGQISPILHSQGSDYRILKMISREPAGQRELTDPRVQQTIRENLLNRKDQLLKSAYYENARNEAKIVNYLAKSIMDTAGKTTK
jgi:peptidyl-prolyl cis-trans isomerase SurA